MRKILHIDMDAFYAAIEQRDRPELRGKPVLAGGSGPRQVVATASYEARAFAVNSAMPGVRAKQLCPHGSFVRPRMEAYGEASQQMQEVFARYTGRVEPLSLTRRSSTLPGASRCSGGPTTSRPAARACRKVAVGSVAQPGDVLLQAARTRTSGQA